MAFPVPDSYSAPSGRPIYGGRRVYPAELLDLIAAAPENSWIQANANRYDAVWTQSAFRPAFGAGVSSPAAIIRAWSSFAWDDENFRLVLFGGGHANTADSSVYLWNASDCNWKLGFTSPDWVSTTNPVGMETKDGALYSAMSAHTYSNQVWLKKAKRFCSFGGATQSSGGGWRIHDAARVGLRSVGCYTLDLTQAGQGKLPGLSGANVKRVGTASEFASLEGAQAWSVRDWALDHPSYASFSADIGTRTNGTALYREEGGRDVVYLRAAHLSRIEMVDSDYRNDIVTRVGQSWTDSPSPQGGALDPVANIALFLRTSATPFDGWNLNAAGSGNKNFSVAAAGVTGSGSAEFLTQLGEAAVFGIQFDAKRDYFALWGRGGRVYSMARPSNLSDLTTGWTVTKLSDDTLSPRPVTHTEMGGSGGDGDTGVSGKWKRSEALDVYIGLQGSNTGKVWMFKPAGWTDPRN